MIPVNPAAMLLGAMVLLISLGAVLLLVAGLLAGLSGRFRRYVSERPRRFAVLAVLLIVCSLPMMQMVAWELVDWREERALSPRLEQDEVLGDLKLPAGTQVWMERLEPEPALGDEGMDYGLRTLKRAEFKGAPGDILGMQVSRIDLDIHRGLAELTLLAPAQVESLRCSTDAVVEMKYPFGAHFDHSQWHLESCSLAAGSEQGGIVWPGKVKVRASGDGEWQVEGDDTPTHFQGFELHSLGLTLDGPGGAVRSWNGLLVNPLDLGPLHYPADTRVYQHGDDLLFQPAFNGAALDRRDGSSVDDNSWVIQRRTGEVIEIGKP